MNESFGKLGSRDPEDIARAAHISKTVTPLVQFQNLLRNVTEARAKGPVYDGIWSVIECLVNEIATLHTEIDELKGKSEAKQPS